MAAAAPETSGMARRPVYFWIRSGYCRKKRHGLFGNIKRKTCRKNAKAAKNGYYKTAHRTNRLVFFAV